MADDFITRNDLPEMSGQMRRALQISHSYLSQEIWGNIREYAPVDHGRLAGSFVLDEKGYLVSTISSNVEYALVQNRGSDPYTIEPNQAQALRFTVGGNVVFATHVDHPGVPGTHYIDRGIADAEQRIDEFVRRGIKEAGL